MEYSTVYPTEPTTDNLLDFAQDDQDEDKASYYADMEKRIFRYGTPVLIAVGTVGNVLTLLVLLCRPAMRTTTTSLYLVILAILDTVLLYAGTLRLLVAFWEGVDVRALSKASCKVHLFVIYVAVHSEAWTLVNVTLERLTAVLLPHKAKVLFSRSRAALGLAVTGACLLAFDLHHFWTYSQQQVDIGQGRMYKYCAVGNRYKPFVYEVWPKLDLSLASALPFTIILVSNTVIIAKIILKRRVGSTQHSSSQNSKISSMTLTLVSVTLTFVLLTMPVCIYFELQERLLENATKAERARIYVIYAWVTLLYYVNSCINFFLYCVSSPKFRRELVLLFKFNRVHPASSRIEPNTSAPPASSNV